MNGQLGAASWPDVPKSALVLVPLGSVEQHGPHLPMDTDTVIAAAVAERAAGVLSVRQANAVFAAPPFGYGASGEHQDFPGTCSIGTEALRLCLVELARSMATWAGRVVFVNGHGGNVPALRAAARQLKAEGQNVGWTVCSIPAGDAHAGHVETSLMLHLAPHRVDMSRAVTGERRSLETLLPALVAGGVRSVSASGVLGDPTGAGAAAGRRILRDMVDDIAARVSAGLADETGRLLAPGRTPAQPT